jgi:hypothetical protein
MASKGLPAAVQRTKVREKDTDTQTETHTLIDTLRTETKHGTRTSIQKEHGIRQKKKSYIVVQYILSCIATDDPVIILRALV